MTGRPDLSAFAWLEDAPAETVIRWAGQRFGARLAATTSLADAVLVDLVARHAPGSDVLFVDTGYHFAETLIMRDAVAATYRGQVNLRTLTPEQTVAEQDRSRGPRLFARDPDQCCALRKVAPLDRALAGYDAWLSGLRRADSAARRRTPVVDWDRRNGKLKLNPIAAWTQDDVDRYVRDHDILTNPLLDQGFRSVGCAPCTRPVLDDGDPRSGRWTGSPKTECGIHLAVR